MKPIVRTAILLALLPLQAAAQYPNVRVSLASSTTPEEVCVAVNPANPLQLAAGANIRFYYRSTDGGLTWAQSSMSSTAFGVWGDPCLVFDNTGTLYYGHLSNTPSPGYWIDRIVVQTSTNHGQTWTDGVGVGFRSPKEQDKEWLGVDYTASPYRNNVYMAWTEFDNYGSSNRSDSSRIRFSRTTDRGVTWMSPVVLSDRGGNCIDSDSTVEGAVPSVGPNGEVYVAWSGPAGIMLDRSTDGGVTWGRDVFVRDHPGGWDMAIPGINRCNGMPITGCDISNSRYRGNVYIGWADQRNGLTDTDIFFIRSTDGGATWGGEKRVNTDLTQTHQFFPWMTVDPVTGYIYFVFYDRRATTGNATDVYVARSTDGGDSFTNFKVSATSFTPQSSVFFGDYTGIAALNGKVYPIWMRMDGTALSVWTALVTDSVATGAGEPEGTPAAFLLEQNYPNPFNPSTMIAFELPAAGAVRLVVTDALGREIETLVDGERPAGRSTVAWNPAGLASGVYYYTLTSGAHRETKRAVLVR